MLLFAAVAVAVETSPPAHGRLPIAVATGGHKASAYAYTGQQAIQSLLQFQGQGMCEDVQNSVLDAVGQGQYDGSSNVPGKFSVSTNQNTGATTVTWTVTADGGQYFSSGPQKFVFRISQDGGTLWGQSQNTLEVLAGSGLGCGGN